jgi:hypothetical protein
MGNLLLTTSLRPIPFNRLEKNEKCAIFHDAVITLFEREPTMSNPFLKDTPVALS